MKSVETGESSPREVPVTAVVLTLDEEINLPHCLDSLQGLREIVVLDSFSRDATPDICRKRDVKFVQNAFEGFGTQRNWLLDNVSTASPWILFLDADERVSGELKAEMRARLAEVPEDVGAFRVKRRFHMWGRWLRYSSLYPTWVVRLVHRDRVRYINRGHAETQSVQGRIADLANDLIDENHKGMDDWFERQNRYASREAAYELALQREPARFSDLVSRDPLARRAALKRVSCALPARALVYFLYSYVLKKGFLDGRDGFEFCRMRALYQGMVAAKKYDLRRRNEG